MPSGKPVAQSAVIAYRQNKQGLRVVLVTSMNTRRWVLPKGHLENGLSPRESAAREAMEEAGVEGIVARRCIGIYEYSKIEIKGGGLRRVEVFAMAVTRIRRSWPEKSQRRRKWMSVNDAITAVNEKKLKKLLAQFGKTVRKA